MSNRGKCRESKVNWKKSEPKIANLSKILQMKLAERTKTQKKLDKLLIRSITSTTFASSSKSKEAKNKRKMK